MKILFEQQVEDKILVCVYCMNKVSGEQRGCCGESSAHFEEAYVLADNEYYLSSEVTLVPQLPIGVVNVCLQN